MNNLLLILGIIALSNGNISLFDNKNKSDSSSSKKHKKTTRERPKNERSSNSIKRKSRMKKKTETNIKEDIFKFDVNDINNGIKLMELSDEDLERGMEIITRTKKYMSREERKILIKVESLLDLVRGIKKLSSIDELDDRDESNFFRSMDQEDKKNMMIREILEVFPEKRKESVEKAIGLKKKIDLFAELFLPDDFGEGGFSLSSLANINNLGSISNLKLLGNLLRGEDGEDLEEDLDKNEDDYYYYEDYEDYEDDDEEENYEYEYEYEYIEEENED